MAKKLVKIDKNGTRFYEERVVCWKCDGTGSYLHYGACWKCQGTGWEVIKTKEYTPEHEAELEAQRAKREAKKDEKLRSEASADSIKFFKTLGFNEAGYSWAIIGDSYLPKEELKARGFRFDYTFGWHGEHDLENFQTIKLSAEDCLIKNEYGAYYAVNNEEANRIINEARDAYKKTQSPSDFFGSVGDKIELDLKFVFEHSIETRFGKMKIYSFRDSDGNVFVWKSSSFLSIEKKIFSADGSRWIYEDEYAHAGDRIRIKATIKAHSEYKDEKQTELTRVKLLNIIEKSED